MNIKIDSAGGTNSHKILIGYLDGEFSSFIKDSEQLKYIEKRLSEEKEITAISHPTRMHIVGLKKGKTEKYLSFEEARKTAYSLYKLLKDAGTEEIELINNGLDQETYLAFVEGLYLSNYQFNKYFTKNNESGFQIQRLVLNTNMVISKKILDLKAMLEGNTFCRDLVNEPLSYLTATKLADEISEKGKEYGFSVEVFNKKKIESLRMGGLLAVNKGSIDPPSFSILEWKPENAINSKPYILVGKGVVYDTGGLSLKPTADSMDYMKCDMAGAGAVAGTFVAVAKAELPIHIIGLIPATDNRPDGNAYVPGDVVTMYDGSTVEVLNTDAEGRMILADALSYAKQYDPELVIELSTLTGAAHAAIGKYAIVGMGNAEKEEMAKLIEAGYNTFERIAEFPFWDDYSELLKSDIADQKNIGGKYAGAITAGKFLEKFTDYPYIHLDIAGPSYNKQEDNYRGKGGSGIGVRLLYDFFNTLSLNYNE